MESLVVWLDANEIHHVLKAENIEVDILSKLALDGVPDDIAQIFLTEELMRTSTDD